MEKLKGWMDKKRTDARFKKAGHGRSLEGDGDRDASGKTKSNPKPTKQTDTASAVKPVTSRRDGT